MSATLRNGALTAVSLKNAPWDVGGAERCGGHAPTRESDTRGIRESLEMTANSYRVPLWAERALPLVTRVVERLRHETRGVRTTGRDPLSCPACFGVLLDPYTLGCGHTYCRPCFLRWPSATCPLCRWEVGGGSYLPSPNVLVASLARKWWPRDVEAAGLRTKANRLFKEGQFDQALDLYTEALAVAPGDHLLLGNRSHTLQALGRDEEALRDAREAVRRRPQWAKGRFRQGRALSSLGRYEEALIALFVCAALEDEEDVPAVVSEIVRTLLLTGGGGLKEGEGERHFPGGDTALDPSSCDSFARIIRGFATEMDLVRDGASARNMDVSIVQPGDLECVLCYQCLWEPLTTPCGHTFCRGCLHRALDHAIHCPLCKSPLDQCLLDERWEGVCEFVDVGVRGCLATEHLERGRQQERELADLAKAGQDLEHEVPIFVATLAFPSVACPLHVFEPRYRLMVRRVMEAGTRQFGMCLPSDAHKDGFSDYGTMLEVREVRPLPGGRRLLNAVGSRRFHCVSKGARDGYHTAAVQFLRDSSVPPGPALEALRLLHDSVHDRARAWFESIDEATKRRILGHYGAMPPVEANYWVRPDGPVWLWWLVAILPLEATIQERLMREPSLAARLALVSQVLRCVYQHQREACRASPCPAPGGQKRTTH